MLYEEKDIALFALGSMVSTGEHVREKLKEKGYSCTLVNARFVKPLDTDMIDRLCRSHRLIVTMEENVLRGGHVRYKIYPRALSKDPGDPGSSPGCVCGAWKRFCIERDAGDRQ